jgi:hypothetical protein
MNLEEKFLINVADPMSSTTIMKAYMGHEGKAPHIQ